MDGFEGATTSDLNALIAAGARIQECTGALELDAWQTALAGARCGPRTMAVWCDRSVWEGWPEGQRPRLIRSCERVARDWVITRAMSLLKRGMSVPDCVVFVHAGVDVSVGAAAADLPAVA